MNCLSSLTLSPKCQGCEGMNRGPSHLQREELLLPLPPRVPPNPRQRWRAPAAPPSCLCSAGQHQREGVQGRLVQASVQAAGRWRPRAWAELLEDRPWAQLLDRCRLSRAVPGVPPRRPQGTERGERGCLARGRGPEVSAEARWAALPLGPVSCTMDGHGARRAPSLLAQWGPVLGISSAPPELRRLLVPAGPPCPCPLPGASVPVVPTAPSPQPPPSFTVLFLRCFDVHRF